MIVRLSRGSWRAILGSYDLDAHSEQNSGLVHRLPQNGF